jgi:hypothetical protein
MVVLVKLVTMKIVKLFFASIICVALFIAPARAQYSASTTEKHHDGFHFSFGLGPVIGHIHDNYNSNIYPSYSAEWRGTGILVDMRIGGAIKQDWILTADLMNKSISSPEISMNDSNYTTNDNVSMDEVSYGIGLTHYFMPFNIYAGVTLGTGTFVLTYTDPESDEVTKTRSEYGFSWMFRAGKSWYLGRKWGLGVGLGYGGTKAEVSGGNGNEKFNATRFVASVAVSYQ